MSVLYVQGGVLSYCTWASLLGSKHYCNTKYVLSFSYNNNLYLFCDQSHDMTPNLPNLTLWAFGFFCFYFHSMFRSYCFMLMPSFIFYLPKGLVRNNNRALRPKYTLHCRVHTKIAENHWHVVFTIRNWCIEWDTYIC